MEATERRRPVTEKVWSRAQCKGPVGDNGSSRASGRGVGPLTEEVWSRAEVHCKGLVGDQGPGSSRPLGSWERGEEMNEPTAGAGALGGPEDHYLVPGSPPASCEARFQSKGQEIWGHPYDS